MLVDSHCHLDFPDFAAELDAVVARAREAGVDMPITEAVCAVLDGRFSPREALDSLLAREPRREVR